VFMFAYPNSIKCKIMSTIKRTEPAAKSWARRRPGERSSHCGKSQRDAGVPRGKTEPSAHPVLLIILL
jgi:hypothetical protein